MSNLKRAFSMVMALVMVLGMITIPTTAAADATVSESIFSDAKEITYGEAVAITGGIGLFAGTDGKFLPKGTVNRAQMATIIVKMLHGADADADKFKGEGKFTDIASFEGGWAEGYINWCSTLGIVSGYGDGTFRPGNEVTTAEAATMVLNALKIDAGEGSWPTTVMSKAAEEGIFEDLKPMPATNKALNREQLAVVALNGLKWSPDEGILWHVVGGSADEDRVFDSHKLAKVYADDVGGTPQNLKGHSSLAFKSYDLKVAEGWITANKDSRMDADYTELISEETGLPTRYNIPSDQSMLGHKVEIWYEESYKNDRQPGVAYTIVEKAEYITLLRDAVDSKEYKTALDRRDVASGGLTLALNGNSEVSTGAAADNVLRGQSVQFAYGTQAPAGTYVIDSETDAICGYIAPTTYTPAKVGYINTAEDQQSITVGGQIISNTPDNDRINEYDGIAKDDYVVYSRVQDKYTVTKMESFSGQISKYSTRTDGKYVVVVDGKEYVESSILFNELTTDFSKLAFNQSYTFYLAPDNTLVGYKLDDATALDLSNTFYVLGVYTSDETDSYGNTTPVHYARGLDMTGNEAVIPVGRGDGPGMLGIKRASEGFYTVEEPTDREMREQGLIVIKAMPTSRDSNNDAAPFVYTFTYGDKVATTQPRWQANGEFAYGYADRFGGSSSTAAPGSSYTYSAKEAKFILLEGAVDQLDPLECQIHTGSVTLYPGAAANGIALLTGRGDGTDEIQAMVWHVPEIDDIVSNLMVYAPAQASVSGNSISWGTACYPSGNTADGNAFNVYDAMTGEAIEIVLPRTITSLPVGFYSVGYNSETGMHSVSTYTTAFNTTSQVHESTDTGAPVRIREYPMDLNATTFQLRDSQMPDESKLLDNDLYTYKYDAATAAQSKKFIDGREYENVLYDLRVKNVGSGNVWFQNKLTNQISASMAALVDLRSDEEVAASGVGRITTLDQVLAVEEAMPWVRIELDLCFQNTGSKRTAFVEVYTEATYGHNTVVFYDGSAADGEGNVKVIAVNSDMLQPGTELSLPVADLPAGAGRGLYSITYTSGTNYEVAASATANGTVVPVFNGDISSRYANYKVYDCTANGFTSWDDIKGASAIDVIYCEVNADKGTIVVLDSGSAVGAQPSCGAVYDNTNGDFEDGDAPTAAGYDAIAQSYHMSTRDFSMASGKVLRVIDSAAKISKVTKATASILNGFPANTVVDTTTLDALKLDVAAGNYVGFSWYFDGSNYQVTVDYNVPAASITALSADTELPAAMAITGSTVLDLAGRNLYSVAADANIVVNSGATLIITDTVGGGRITGRSDAADALIVVETGGELVLQGGEITGHTNTGDGGAVRVGVNAEFTMTGGVITGNTAKYGAGVYVEAQAVFTMTGGEISGNTATERGGAIHVKSMTEYDKSKWATVNISGDASISGNKATGASSSSSTYGLYIYNAYVNISGGNVADTCWIRGADLNISGGSMASVATRPETGKICTIKISGTAKVGGLAYSKTVSGVVDEGSLTISELASGAEITLAGTDFADSVDGTVLLDGKVYSYRQG